MRMIDKGSFLKVSRFAILKEFRNKQLGSKMLQFAIDHSKSLGIKRFLLDSEEETIGFYEKNGFKIISDFF